MSFVAGSSASTASKDIEVVHPPTDSISSLAFSPQADLLAAGSWSNEVRVYEVLQSGQTQPKAAFQHEQPVLSISWNKDGTHIFSGSADRTVKAFDVATGQTHQVAQHDGPVKCVKWIDAPHPTGGILATGSWDKTLKYWDLRQPNAIATVQLAERCYTMSSVYPLLVVGTAERQIQVFNLSNPTTVYRSIRSPLKWQTRAVACFPDAKGFAVASIEGRLGIQYTEEKDSRDNFSFRCHRQEPPPASKDATKIFSVNDVTFHQQQGTFATAGSDGTVSFWDKDSRTRLKTLDAAAGPVVATVFNRTGTICAYAVSYDWSKGHSGMVTNHPNKIMLHAVKEEEVKRRGNARR